MIMLATQDKKDEDNEKQNQDHTIQTTRLWNQQAIAKRRPKSLVDPQMTMALGIVKKKTKVKVLKTAWFIRMKLKFLNDRFVMIRRTKAVLHLDQDFQVPMIWIFWRCFRNNGRA